MKNPFLSKNVLLSCMTRVYSMQILFLCRVYLDIDILGVMDWIMWQNRSDIVDSASVAIEQSDRIDTIGHELDCE